MAVRRIHFSQTPLQKCGRELYYKRRHLQEQRRIDQLPGGFFSEAVVVVMAFIRTRVRGGLRNGAVKSRTPCDGMLGDDAQVPRGHRAREIAPSASRLDGLTRQGPGRKVTGAVGKRIPPDGGTLSDQRQA
jgi:hypothetical protein